MQTTNGIVYTVRYPPAKPVAKVDALSKLAAHHAQHQRPAAAAAVAAAAARVAAADGALSVLLKSGLHRGGSARLPENTLARSQCGQRASSLPALRRLLRVRKRGEERDHALRSKVISGRLCKQRRRRQCVAFWRHGGVYSTVRHRPAHDRRRACGAAWHPTNQCNAQHSMAVGPCQGRSRQLR